MLSIIFRTLGAWGAGKGSNLTPAEMDGNFYEIKQAVEDLQDNPTPPNGIANITQDGTQLTIYLDDSTALGPFTLPSAPAIIPAVEKSADAFTLGLNDRNTYMICTHVDGCTVSLEAEADSDIPAHAEFHFRREGGPIIIDAPTDIEVRGIQGFLHESGAAGAVMTLKYIGDDVWHLFGLLAEDSTEGTGTV